MSLNPEQLDDLQKRGESQIVTNDLENAGRLKNPYESRQINNPGEKMISEDQARFDVLEAVKSGDLSQVTDPAEREAFTKRHQEEGQKGLESMAEAKQRKITEGPIEPEKLATHVAETVLGTDARGTEDMDQAIQAAREGIEKATS